MLESRQAQARRWAKFPATVLFTVGALWLVHKVLEINWSHDQPSMEKGLGILYIVFSLLIVPLGSIVVAFYLLLRKEWAFIPAPLLPLLPLFVVSSQKLANIQRQFAAFHDSSSVPSLSNGVTDCFVLVAFWVVYVLMLLHLRKAWGYLPRSVPRWGAAAGVADAQGAGAAPDDDADVCFLLPESGDVE